MTLPTPLTATVGWLLTWKRLAAGALMIAVVGTTFGVSYAAFETRQKYARMQSLEAESARLDSEYEKLLLEQSAWAAYSRVDDISRNKLEMRVPRGDHLVVVAP